MPNEQPVSAGTGPRTAKSLIREENERIILAAAEKIFAEYGFKGATTAAIAELAGIPKPNLHYYFSTKKDLYRRVVLDVFDVWLQAADSLDHCEDPKEGLTRYITAKMELARRYPYGSKVWANEILHGAPVTQDILETSLRSWLASREAIIQGWIDAGKMKPVEPRYLLYMIWATTQHYADFGHQIETLNDGKPLEDQTFAKATETVLSIILGGLGLLSTDRNGGLV